MKAIIHRKPTSAEKEIVSSVMKQVEDQMQTEQNKAILRTVKMACIVLNEEFGFGAEIGISTQKIHARGPMGLEQMTSYKYCIRGNGQIR